MSYPRILPRTFAVSILAVGLLCASTAKALIIRIQTMRGNIQGNIDVRLYETAAPQHVANFLNYINSGRYDGTFIHRSANSQNGQDFVIQGGGYKLLTSLLDEPLESGWEHIPTFSTVPNEPGISNLRGTLALAKGSGISSGTSEWFINMNDANSFLDQPAPISNQFTVFGRVVLNGMAVADQIAALPTVDARVQVGQSILNGAFGELPVVDFDKVIDQQDVFPEDTIRVPFIFVRSAIPAADYNFDAQVTLADYNVWRSTFGSTTNAAADGNGNGIVDAADFIMWRDAFVAAGGALVGNVPEPGSTVLLVILGMSLMVMRRRRS